MSNKIDIYNNYEKIFDHNLEDLLIKFDLKNSSLKQKRATTPKESKCLLAVVRDKQGRIQTIKSNTDKFQSERQIDYSNVPIMFGSGWLSDRVMEVVSLYVSPENVLKRRFTEDYNFFPRELTDLIEEGVLKTSGSRSTDYSVLMSITERNGNSPPKGRTGVLLYKGKPVVVSINGKEFVVEIKGVGCPDGNNSRIEQMHRNDYFGQGSEEYGGFDEKEGLKEFNNLQIQRRKSRTFADGDAVRAAAVFTYETEKTYKTGEVKKVRQAYLIRLAPSNVRSSFNNNPNFPKIENKGMLLTTSIGKQYAELANLKETLLHSTIHPENIVWTGTRYVLTDFADCVKLRDIDNPHDFLDQVLCKIKEVPGLTEAEINNFYSTIANELAVSWDPSTGYDVFINALWNDFFAERVYVARKGKTKRVDEQVKASKSLLTGQYVKYENPLTYLFVNGAKSFLEQEIDLLEHVDAPEARESLIIARQRATYLSTQLEEGKNDINKRFKKNPNSFYDLFYLPYMKSTK